MDLAHIEENISKVNWVRYGLKQLLREKNSHTFLHNLALCEKTTVHMGGSPPNSGVCIPFAAFTLQAYHYLPVINASHIMISKWSNMGKTCIMDLRNAFSTGLWWSLCLPCRPVHFLQTTFCWSPNPQAQRNPWVFKCPVVTAIHAKIRNAPGRRDERKTEFGSSAIGSCALPLQSQGIPPVGLCEQSPYSKSKPTSASSQRINP